MRSRPWLVFAFLLSLAATACTTASPATSAEEETAVASASTDASTDASAEASAQTSGAVGGDELDWELPPNFGDTELSAGFTPDPFSIEVVSGGPIDATYLGDECGGFATAAPDFDVRYTGGSQGLLRFYFVADTAGEDTTLIVNAPDESWHCNDDAIDTLNPQVDFENPESGLYDIWIGSFESGAQVTGTLYVTEVSSNRP